MHKQKGFSVVHILVVLLVVGIVAGAGWYVVSKQKDDNKTTTKSSNSSSSATQPAATTLTDNNVHLAIMAMRDSLNKKDYSAFKSNIHSEFWKCIASENPEYDDYYKNFVTNFDKNKTLTTDDLFDANYYSLARKTDEEISKFTIKDTTFSNLNFMDCKDISTSTKNQPYRTVSYIEKDQNESGTASIEYSYTVTIQNNKVVVADIGSGVKVNAGTSGN